MNAYSRQCALISLSAIVICGQAALAQTQQQDEERMRREGVERADAAARAQGMEMERQRQERERQQEEQRRSQANSQPSPSTGGGYTPAPSGASSGRSSTDMRAGPKLPAERNVLLGSWRVDSGRQGGGAGLGQGNGTDRNAMARELLTTFTNPCVLMFGKGITFAPSTYSIEAIDGSVFRGSVDYRSTQKQVISAVTEQSWKTLSFEIEGPNRVVWERFGCALVRVGAPANAQVIAATAAGNTRTATASRSAPSAAGAPPQMATVAPSPPPSTLSRPPAEVCRNTLLDKLGKVGIDQVRAMAKVRYTETPIEGKVPNTDNLRLDLRSSACGEDPRVKASLYDFDSNGVLQSITLVWDRPAGPAPAPIFTERVSTLSRFHTLPPPQSPGRLQADTSLGRLILEDIPERNLLLEAYAAKK